MWGDICFVDSFTLETDIQQLPCIPQTTEIQKITPKSIEKNLR